MTDYYAHLFNDDPKAIEEVEDEDFNIDDVEELIKYKPKHQPDDDWETM